MSEAEESRAAAFRAEQVARAQFRAANRRTLAGDSSARVSLLAAWAPWWVPQPLVLDPLVTNDPPTNAD